MWDHIFLDYVNLHNLKCLSRNDKNTQSHYYDNNRTTLLLKFGRNHLLSCHIRIFATCKNPRFGFAKIKEIQTNRIS